MDARCLSHLIVTLADALCQDLKPRTFEIAVLLAVNEALLEDDDEIPTDGRVQDIVEKVINIFESEIGLDAAFDLGLGANTDDFVVEEEELDVEEDSDDEDE